MPFLPGVKTNLFGDISVYPSLVQFQILPSSQHSQIKCELSPFLVLTLAWYSIFLSAQQQCKQKESRMCLSSVCPAGWRSSVLLPGISPTAGSLRDGDLRGTVPQHTEGRALPFRWEVHSWSLWFYLLSELKYLKSLTRVSFGLQEKSHAHSSSTQHPALALYSLPWSSNCFWGDLHPGFSGLCHSPDAKHMYLLSSFSQCLTFHQK